MSFINSSLFNDAFEEAKKEELSSSEPAVQNKPWHRTGGNSYTYTSNYNKPFSNNPQDADRGAGVTSEPWRKKKGEPILPEGKPHYYDNNKKYEKPFGDKREGYDQSKREGYDQADRERDREANAEMFEKFLIEFADVVEVSHQENKTRFTRDELLGYYSPYYRPPSTLEQVDKVTSRIPLLPVALAPPTQTYEDDRFKGRGRGRGRGIDRPAIKKGEYAWGKDDDPGSMRDSRDDDEDDMWDAPVDEKYSLDALSHDTHAMLHSSTERAIGSGLSGSIGLRASGSGPSLLSSSDPPFRSLSSSSEQHAVPLKSSAVISPHPIGQQPSLSSILQPLQSQHIQPLTSLSTSGGIAQHQAAPTVFPPLFAQPQTVSSLPNPQSSFSAHASLGSNPHLQLHAHQPALNQQPLDATSHLHLQQLSTLQQQLNQMLADPSSNLMRAQFQQIESQLLALKMQQAQYLEQQAAQQAQLQQQQQQQQQLLQQQQQALLIENRNWFYQVKGKSYGPYNARQMQTWLEKNFFETTIELRVAEHANPALNSPQHAHLHEWCQMGLWFLREQQNPFNGESLQLFFSQQRPNHRFQSELLVLYQRVEAEKLGAQQQQQMQRIMGSLAGPNLAPQANTLAQIETQSVLHALQGPTQSHARTNAYPAQSGPIFGPTLPQGPHPAPVQSQPQGPIFGPIASQPTLASPVPTQAQPASSGPIFGPKVEPKRADPEANPLPQEVQPKKKDPHQQYLQQAPQSQPELVRRDPWHHFDQDTEASRREDERRREERERKDRQDKERLDKERDAQAKPTPPQPSQPLPPQQPSQPQPPLQPQQQAKPIDYNVIVANEKGQDKAKAKPADVPSEPASLAEIQQQELAKTRPATGAHASALPVLTGGGRGSGKPITANSNASDLPVDSAKTDPLRRLWDMSFVSDAAEQPQPAKPAPNAVETKKPVETKKAVEAKDEPVPLSKPKIQYHGDSLLTSPTDSHKPADNKPVSLTALQEEDAQRMAEYLAKQEKLAQEQRAKQDQLDRQKKQPWGQWGAQPEEPVQPVTKPPSNGATQSPAKQPQSNAQPTTPTQSNTNSQANSGPVRKQWPLASKPEVQPSQRPLTLAEIQEQEQMERLNRSLIDPEESAPVIGGWSSVAAGKKNATSINMIQQQEALKRMEFAKQQQYKSSPSLGGQPNAWAKQKPGVTTNLADIQSSELNKQGAKSKTDDSGFFDYDDDEGVPSKQSPLKKQPTTQAQTQPQNAQKKPAPSPSKPEPPKQNANLKTNNSSYNANATNANTNQANAPNKSQPQQPLPKKPFPQQKPAEQQQQAKAKSKKPKGRSVDPSELGFTSNIDSTNVIKFTDMNG